MSDSVRPHKWQPTRLPHPWDSPGKNTGVVCHFLLQCMKVKSESEVIQLCPILSDPLDCSLLGSSIHGIFQARVLEWGAIAFSIAWHWGSPKYIQHQICHFNHCSVHYSVTLITFPMLCHSKSPRLLVSDRPEFYPSSSTPWLCNHHSEALLTHLEIEHSGNQLA